ncbi:methyl-accepting chemotaxis protein 2 [Clostridium saccharobutylicum]|uniref:methyl-accepting chemotaxis protein n=1 Tax=Clostridium saccharobutylicum TaxID=169679 RepID=UPI000983F363|nr:methyl-accepting chemotaxis protein [Clostridium saccharobutylicum]AQS11296.1 methyl-accepting chemotaxis protein 2 [Clostridium saccharobutylicum]MBC2437161.1 chemotaxis protein [Clostridium saccharobutylicum]NSB88688.1 methyl-accepting chemotaxis protein [Clostridium saccharobutylicum]NYC30734.1 methyl-accepting chemotaxis protein [Clostridium saccharobutylicum]OOM15386.1 methyl-accepting chemotaxis protein 2 [Clostridium saccharobutylicum]
MFNKLKRNEVDTSKSLDENFKKTLLEVLEDAISGKFYEVDEEKFGSRKVADKWNEMIKQICNFKKDTTLQINELLQTTTKLDIIKEMISSSNKQTDALHSMSASSEELSASIDEVANMSETVADKSRSVKELAEDGVTKITDSMEFVKNSFYEMNEINKTMEDVKEKTVTINSIVDMVKGIADQTNLLALNAAIEAARAGEQGKGFAVVADEVRSLAENTKESVLNIEMNIQELQKSIDVSVDKINSTSAKLGSGQKIVDDVLVSINSINSAIESVNETIVQVAANTEEQTAVTHTVAESISKISVEADYLNSSSNKTGKSIYDLSKEIDMVRVNAVKDNNCLSDVEKIEIYKTDHLLWRWKIYNMILGYEKVDIHVVADYKNCALGKWYYGIDCSNIKDNSVFLKLEQPHIELHKIAKEAVVQYENGNLSAAEKCLEEMDKCSNQVFAILDEIKKLYR